MAKDEFLTNAFAVEAFDKEHVVGVEPRTRPASMVVDLFAGMQILIFVGHEQGRNDRAHLSLPWVTEAGGRLM